VIQGYNRDCRASVNQSQFGVAMAQLLGNWVVLGLLSAAFAALVAIFGKIGLSNVDSITATAVRSVIMAIVVVAAVVLTGRTSYLGQIQGNALLWIALSGAAGAASWMAYFAAIQIGQTSGVAALDRLSIVFVVVLAGLFLGEGFSWEKLVGAGLITAGALLIAR